MGFIQHKIPSLYRRRTFSDKFSDTMDFITANWRVLIRMLTIVLLPLCTIQAINFNSFLNLYAVANSASANSDVIGLGLNYLSMIVFSMIVSGALVCVLFGIMKLYHSLDEDGNPAVSNLNSMTFSQFRPILKEQVVPALKSIGAFLLLVIALFITFFAIIFVIVVNSVNSLMVGLLVAVLILAATLLLFPAFMLVFPIYSFERIGFFDGIVKAVKYGIKTWRGVVAVTFVVGMLVSVVVGVLGLPWTILMVMKMIFVADNENALAFTSTPWYSFVMYLSSIVYMFVSYVGYSVLFVALAYQYGHAHEVVDGADIDDF